MAILTSLAPLVVLMMLNNLASSQNDCVGDFTIYIVLDGSESFGLENFQTAKNSLNDFVVDNLGRNPNNRIGVIVYSDKVTENITATSNRDELRAAINSISYPDGGTATQFGIASATAHLLEDPFENTKIMIVITDGLSGQPFVTAAAAEFAKSKGITTFAVGLTATVVDFEDHLQNFNSELQSIASNNTEIYNIDNFSGLSAILANVSRALCSLDVNIVNSMKDQTVLEGSNVRMSTTLNQAGITDGRWTFEDRSLSSTTRYNTGTAGRLQYLDITDVRVNEGGSYSYAYNTAGSGAVLTVLGLMANQTARVGEATIFQTRVSPSTTEGMWLKNGAPLSRLNDKYTTEVLDGGFQRLTINNADAADTGKYAYVINGVETSAFLELSAIDGGWSDYGDWQPDSSCLVTCGQTRRRWTRLRECNNPVPSPGGQPCTGESIQEAFRPCENSPVCPVNGIWGEWEAWRELCNAQTCGTFPGRRVRQRKCDNPAPNELGEFCLGEAFESENFVCNRTECDVNGEWGAWANWATTDCLSACGEGVRIRTRDRLCDSPAPKGNGDQCDGDGDERETETCYNRPCPIDGNWSAWSPWAGEECPVCGGGTVRRSRLRECNSPRPFFGGVDCEGDPFENEIHTCVTDDCPVDGGEGPWSEWVNESTCSATCGDTDSSYVRERRRECNEPAPSNGGSDCRLKLIERQQISCGYKQCPIDGGFSEWGAWGPPQCDEWFCGRDREGPSLRFRTCDNPSPAYEGRNCEGSPMETAMKSCNFRRDCPADGTWTDWGEWRNFTCSQTCGRGTLFRTKTRVCIGVQNGGQACQGSDTETESIDCVVQECPVDGSWSSWAITEPPCPVTCEGQIVIRRKTRVCDNPAPANGGRTCEGGDEELTPFRCNPDPCPVNGTWSNWRQWTTGDCSVTCGGGVLIRNRTRQCIEPSFGGAYCPGPDTETETVACGTNPCIVNGNWGFWNEWSDTSACSASCEGGTYSRERSRACDSPAPNAFGQPCIGDAVQTETLECNTDRCRVDGGWAPWNTWLDTPCSHTCGGGTYVRSRSRACINPAPRGDGAFCTGSDTMIISLNCNTNPCIVDGNWGFWSRWSDTSSCTVTCGGGNYDRRRTRACDSPAPSLGQDCVGEDVQTDSPRCNEDPCQEDGSWSPWTNWLTEPCSVTCGGGVQHQNRTRACTSPAPRDGGRFCPGPDTEVNLLDCFDGPCSVDGVWSNWNEWSNPACPVTCEGPQLTRERRRQCNNPPPREGGATCPGNALDTVTFRCNPDPCPVDGAWTAWNQWINDTCSDPCGGGTLLRTRTKLCIAPAPSNGGKHCPGPDTETQTDVCNTSPCLINGNWGFWSRWSESPCSVTCGTGVYTQRRNRTCDSPAPFLGLPCVGDGVETQTLGCNEGPCKVDGAWTQWTQWTNGSCSRTCGAGTLVRTRTKQCIAPAPQNGGAFCPGPDTQRETQGCNQNSCIVNGNWGFWNEWIDTTTCPVTCGGGNYNRERRRICDSPAPNAAGQPCVGQDLQTETPRCNTDPCKGDGQWSQWNQWIDGDCSATCGDGTLVRTRRKQCDSPVPSNGGAFCPGSDTETLQQDCNRGLCSVDGVWSNWNEWSNPACPVTCNGSQLTRERRRQCNNPPPREGGATCPGNALDTVTFRCNPDPCPVDGLWTLWTQWSTGTCSRTCDGGTLVRTRTKQCIAPAPQNGGKHCEGPDTETEGLDCNQNPCIVNGNWGFWSTWSDIGSCSVTCGGGNVNQERRRICDSPAPNAFGQTCPGQNSQVQPSRCNTDPCKVDGAWTPWSQWFTEPCSVTCGDGVQHQNRTRECTAPAPRDGGLSCPGPDTEINLLDCNPGACTVDGVWSNWNEWSNPACPVTCNGPQLTRERRRQCNNPPPREGGATCPGNALDTLTFRCNPDPCPIDGQWTQWNQWSPGTCSRTCGGGTLVRTRTKQCIAPAPQNGGAFCPGPDTQRETQNCNQNTCIVNGNWGFWNEWSDTSDCSLTCGGGTYSRVRRRDCDSPAPNSFGQPCSGNAVQTERPTCNTDPCKVDGQWTQWNQWSTGICSRTCGGGTLVRTRTKQCIAPAPSNGGAFCPGSDTERETQDCSQNPCIINGVWSPWNEWSVPACPATCGTASVTKRKQRLCNNPEPRNGGSQCPGNDFETTEEICIDEACPGDGVWTNWNPWTEGPCQVSCGSGSLRRTRGRSCVFPDPTNPGRSCPGFDSDSDTQPCEATPCPVDGNWANWNQWVVDPCPVSCGGAQTFQTRFRSCSNPQPENDGRQCDGTPSETEPTQCNTDECVVNGQWANWANWNIQPCPVTCGGGTRTQFRTRLCIAPAPSGGGNFCEDLGFEIITVACRTETCVVNGQPSPWSNWVDGTCSLTCGTGTLTGRRERLCNDPEPSGGGAFCTDPLTEERTIDCNTDPCPTDGNWAPWAEWNTYPCPLTCGGAMQFKERTRSCSTPPPLNGGRYCEGSDTDTTQEPCGTGPCPVNGSWSDWRVVVQNDCPVTCGRGLAFRLRTRTCSNPPPSGEGADCPGDNGANVYFDICNDFACPVNGNWNEWTNWDNPTCSVSCGSTTATVQRSRYRQCNDPPPSNGQYCPGSATDNDLQPCGRNPCPQDGEWSQWDQWTDPACPVSCGRSVRFRVRRRTCEYQSALRGAGCLGSDTETESEECGGDDCPINGGWSDWDEYQFSDCTRSCGGGERSRTRTRRCDSPTPNPTGAPCPGDSIESDTVSCNIDPCPINGNWGEWSAWNDPGCERTCGSMLHRDIVRRRQCNDPAPLFGGLDCQGSSILNFSMNCGLPHCPGYVEGICMETENIGGVGYALHPEDCDKYIQCYFNVTSDVVTSEVVGIVRSCPFGYYWDPETIRCDHSWKVKCEKEKCLDPDCTTIYDMEGSCRAYWACENGSSIAQCCDKEFRFVPGRGCMPDPYCIDECPGPCINGKDVCDRVPTGRADSFNNMQANFQLLLGNIGWAEGTCTSPRSRYDMVKCDCVEPLSGCTRDISDNFDTVGTRVTTGTVNIDFTNRIARFNGEGSLTYTGVGDRRSRISTLKFSYKQDPFNAATPQVLASSTYCQDCDNASSIVVSLARDVLNVDIKTMSGGIVRAPISTLGLSDGDWKRVKIVHTTTVLTVTVSSDNYEYIHQEWAPDVELYSCGITFGSQSFSAVSDYSGDIRQIEFYNCEAP